MAGTLADLSEEDRALLTPEELAAWEEIDGIEAGESGDDQGENEDGETDEERDARIEREEAAAREATEEATRVAADEAKKTAAKPKKEEGKPEKTPEELEAEAAAEAEDKKPEPVARAPRPLFNAQLPADMADQRKALDTREDELADKFDEGELTTKEYNAGLRDLNRERVALDRLELKAELAQESTQARNEESWETTAETFLAEHPAVTASMAKTVSFNHFVMQETGKSMDAGKQPSRGDLERAFKLWADDMGIDAAAAPAAKPVKKPATAPKNVPPSLANTPAAGANDTDDGKFAHLDSLVGEEFERALDKLSETDKAAYFAS